MVRSHSKGPEQHASRAPSQRQLRAGELVRHAVAELLSRGEVMDAEVTALMITVPEVRMSPDLRNATVYVTPLAGGDPKTAVKALERNKRWIRGQVAHKVSLKYAPDLVFRFDDRFEESARIDELLRSPEVAQDLGHEDDQNDQR
ncbi:MAG TPA: 30S ribosome-binding factor RbfA [Methylomirabilota bacterium]|nr:30S ribosome-binding factor RbfA [Methylomirabilota bacterium]